VVFFFLFFLFFLVGCFVSLFGLFVCLLVFFVKETFAKDQGKKRFLFSKSFERCKKEEKKENHERKKKLRLLSFSHFLFFGFLFARSSLFSSPTTKT